jgi:hypothetical protein
VTAPSESRRAFLPGLRVAALGLAAFGATAHLSVLAVLFASRIGYCFDIEWLEGGALLQAVRLRQGLPLYGPPSLAFIPFNYTPLEPWLVATLSRLLFLPIGYPLGRAVSIAAFAAGCVAIYLAVRREGGEHWEAWCALGVLAGGFAFTGGWFDLVRVDSLYLALAVGGFAVLRRRGETWTGVALGAVLLALSFFAKQAASVFVAAGAVALCAVRIRLVPLYLAVSGGLVAAGYGFLQWRSGGWFRRWVFEVPSGHPIERDVLFGRAWERMAQPLWPVWLLVAGAIILAVRRRAEWRGLAFWGIFVAAAAAATALGASIRLAYLNAYLPALFAAALLAGIAAGVWRRTSGFTLGLGAPLLLVLQLGISAYDPRPFLPGPNRARAERFVGRLREMPGEVLVPYHPFAAVQAGKAPSFHTMALAAMGYGGVATPAEFAESIAAQRYSAIVLDRAPERSTWATYKLDAFLHEPESPASLTGFPVRPRYVLVPRRAQPAQPGTVALLDFENGSWEGWEISGEAFGPAPNAAPARFQGPVGPFRGLFFADSGNPTVRSTGRALSPEFSIPASPLRLLVGGSSSSSLAARLVIAGRVERSAGGQGDDELRPVEWDVAPWVGRIARLELLDEDANGYLLVDDLAATESPAPR